MTRTGAAAIAAARTISTGYSGQCLQFVRTSFGLAAKYPTATSAWASAKYKHKTSNPGSIPAGVPVFFSKPGHPNGHVTVSLGGSRMRSTDTPGLGHVADCDITLYTNAGWTLLGWAEDLNGVRVYSPAPTFTNITGLQKAVRATADNVSGPNTRKRVDAVRKATTGAFPYGRAFTQQVVATKVDGIWGTNSKAALTKTVKAVQKAVGVTADGIWGPNTETAVTKALKGAHQA